MNYGDTLILVLYSCRRIKLPNVCCAWVPSEAASKQNVHWSPMLVGKSVYDVTQSYPNVHLQFLIYFATSEFSFAIFRLNEQFVIFYGGASTTKMKK